MAASTTLPNPGDSAYSAAQVSEYLVRVGLPPSYHPSAKPTLDYAYLKRIFVHQITTFPYENLSLHYSPSHTITLDPQALYAKLMTADRGRGGYCMENSIFLNHMLRALGFDAFLSGVRIRLRENGVPQGDFTGWRHLVNIVTLADPGSPAGLVRYSLDAGFGGDGPTLPLPLVDGLVHHNNIGTQEIRLVRDLTPVQRWRAPDAPRMWIYQYRNGADKDWNSFYSFGEFEFIEDDFAIINWYTSSHPESFQTFTVLIVKFLRGRKEGAEEDTVTGKVMLVNELVKRNVTGKTEIVKVCKTEAERREALREWFGIELTPVEAEGIKGRVVDLDRPTEGPI
ncbi:arylamine N-acetyltransferase 2 [Thozetella sp. PMI_491]|nr:arylamine N-acetyltransferase 2 [Thozetella sp. PMI_491]